MGQTGFSPDQFLNETAPAASQGFNPDQFLKDTSGSEPEKETKQPGFLSRIGNAAIENLPAEGAIIGAALGAPAGGVGALPGAAVGGALGAGARRMIRGFQDQGLDYLTNKPTVSGTLDAAKDEGYGAVQGTAQELGGQFMSAAAKSFAGSGLTDVSKQGLMDAAGRLGITPTVGMKSKDYVTRGMESSLEQSPTIAGAATRKQTFPVRQALNDAAENLLKDASDSSAYETGISATKGVSAKLGEKLNTAQMAYENFNQELPKMVPDFEAKAKLADDVAKATKGNLSFNLPETWGESVSNKIVNAQSLADIEDVRKQVGDSLSSAYRSGDRNAISAISKIQDHLEDFRDNQFVALAKQNYSGKAGENIGKQMVDEYQSAQKQWAELYSDAKELGHVFGIQNKNPKAFVEAVQNINPETMVKKLFTPNNVDKLKVVAENFPEEFQQVKNLKLAEIKSASTTVVNGSEVIDPMKFVKQVDKLPAEVQQSLFGDKLQTIKDIKTVAQAFPAKMGPSGTPQGTSFMKALDLGEPFRQAGALGQRAFLNARGSSIVQKVANSQIPSAIGKVGIGAVGTMVNPSPDFQSQPVEQMPQQQINPMLGTQPQQQPGNRNPSSVPQMPMPSPTPQSSNPQTAPTKGPEKWAKDGFQNLKGHVNDDDRKFLDEYKGAMMFDPKSKQLLITASNYPAGSKPLNDIMKHLKNKYEGKSK